jgi:polyhydroxybutyrate depolymerase
MKTKKKCLTTLLVLLAAVIGCLFSSTAYTATITGVTPVDPATIANGTPLADVLAALPSQTTITVDVGDPIPVDLTWSLREKVITSRGGNEVFQIYYPTARGFYEMQGDFVLPSGVEQSDPPTDLFVITEVTMAGSTSLLSVYDTTYFDQPGEYGRVTKTYYGTIDRTYDYYVPSSYNGDPMPLVITLHGAGSYGAGQLYYSEFDDLGEQEGFIVVAPDYGYSAYGIFLFPGIANFASDIIDDMSAIYNIDLRRVYASGISMGGYSSLLLSYSLPNRIAAVAPVASGANPSIILPEPKTIILFYGTRDSGWGADGANIYAGIANLVAQNQCFTDPMITDWDSVVEMPNETTITQFTYDGGVYGTEVIFYRVNEGGHTWPGKYQYASLISVGLTSQEFDATEVIWDHLKIHTLPMSAMVDIRHDSINPEKKGVIPVAVLTTQDFDASTVEVETVQFGPTQARAEHGSVEDVNGDGLLDMIMHFRAQETGIMAGDTSAMLTGRSSVFGAFYGSDSFETVPKAK